MEFKIISGTTDHCQRELNELCRNEYLSVEIESFIGAREYEVIILVKISPSQKSIDEKYGCR